VLADLPLSSISS